MNAVLSAFGQAKQHSLNMKPVFMPEGTTAAEIEYLTKKVDE